MNRRFAPIAAALLALIARAASLQAQGSAPPAAGERATAAVTSIADSALAAISRGDMIAFTDLMIPEAVLYPTSTRDGVSRYSVRPRDAQRASPMRGTVTERGWNPEARINGAVAMVWYPYDLYVNGNWSHCGVDIFTLVWLEGRWRITSMTWSAEQPPVCSKHPAGPPPGAKP